MQIRLKMVVRHRAAKADGLQEERDRLRCLHHIPGFIHFYKPVTIPALLDLFRDNLDDGITIRSGEQLRLFFLRQCEKYASTRHTVLRPTRKLSDGAERRSLQRMV